MFAGNLISRKGVHLLVEAAAKLKNLGVPSKLMIVGDGPHRNRVAQFIHENDLTSFVTLEGAKSQKDLLYYYNAADLFVLPSLMESFGLVFIEAMLCGCPVIGTPQVLNELLISDDYGYYVTPGDIEALVKAIRKALSRSWDNEKIRKYALNFDWNKRIHEFEKAYEELLG